MILTRLLCLLPLPLILAACDPVASGSEPPSDPQTGEADLEALRSSVVRINSTQQDWNPWQPWEKNPPTKRRALGAIIGPQEVITTAELAANATYIEFESADGTRFTPATVIARDDEANLALLAPADPDKGREFFEGTVPFKIAEASNLGDTL